MAGQYHEIESPAKPDGPRIALPPGDPVAARPPPGDVQHRRRRIDTCDDTAREGEARAQLSRAAAKIEHAKAGPGHRPDKVEILAPTVFEIIETGQGRIVVEQVVGAHRPNRRDQKPPWAGLPACQPICQKAASSRQLSAKVRMRDGIRASVARTAARRSSSAMAPSATAP